MIDKKAVEEIMKSIEMDIFGWPSHSEGLRSFLDKLDVKSARMGRGLFSGSALKVESLEATLKQVTFDDTKLKLWNKPNVKLGSK